MMTDPTTGLAALDALHTELLALFSMMPPAFGPARTPAAAPQGETVEVVALADDGAQAAGFDNLPV